MLLSAGRLEAGDRSVADDRDPAAELAGRLHRPGAVAALLGGRRGDKPVWSSELRGLPALSARGGGGGRDGRTAAVRPNRGSAFVRRLAAPRDTHAGCHAFAAPAVLGETKGREWPRKHATPDPH